VSDNSVKGAEFDNVTVGGPTNVNIYDKQRSTTLEDRVMDLERLIYGESKWSEPGMIKRQQQQITISQINTALNAITLLTLIIYMLWS
jgi:hypothetical protein